LYSPWSSSALEEHKSLAQHNFQPAAEANLPGFRQREELLCSQREGSSFSRSRLENIVWARECTWQRCELIQYPQLAGTESCKLLSVLGYHAIK
jgi:hypothetical protein